MFHVGGDGELEGFVSSAQNSLEFKFGECFQLYLMSNLLLLFFFLSSFLSFFFFFLLVKTEDEFFNEELVFRPVYTHQVFEK